MISSESINYSKYTIEKEKVLNVSKGLIIHENKQKIDKDKTDLNSIISNENYEYNDNDKLIISFEKSKESKKKDTLYGNPIENINPKYLGNMCSFIYNSNGDPAIAIGPDCKLNIFN